MNRPKPPCEKYFYERVGGVFIFMRALAGEDREIFEDMF